MKKRILAMLTAAMMVVSLIPAIGYADTPATKSGEKIAIDATNFPDENFREAVREYDDGAWDCEDVLDEWDCWECTCGNDGYLSQSEIEEVESLWISYEDIKSLEGLQYLTSLESLDCGGNGLFEIPALSDSLTYLDCSDNKLTELPELPSSLTELDCRNNFLLELPVLPSGLTELYCSENYLEQLPALPSGITELSCYMNALTTLPELPASLTSLVCWENQLTSLPALPSGITRMNVESNKLTTLPALPAKLQSLNCYNNQLTSLPALPDTVTELNCGYNKLTVLPELPAELTYLSCYENQLKALPALPKYLETLYASSNKLTGVLDISQNWFLNNVDLYDNVLTGLVVSDKVKYEDVNVSDNYMAGKDAVTGRTDIDWDGAFRFGYQKEYCDVYGHKYVKSVRKSKVVQNGASSGSVEYICSKCEAYKSGSYVNIPYVSKIKLSTTSYAYNGKAKKPTVKVYDSNNKLISSSNYTVSYASGRKNVGTYKVTVKFKGNYTGSRYVTFKINPAKPANVKLTSGKKQFKVSWKKPSAAYRNQIDGYQIRYATSKSGLKKATPKKYSGKTLTNKTIKKLKSKKTYYVQVRTYNKVGKTTYYSGWTAAKKIKTK